MLFVWIGFLNPFGQKAGQLWVPAVLVEFPPSLAIPGWGSSQALTSPTNKVTFCAGGRRSGKASSSLKKVMVLRSAPGWGMGREKDKSGQ